MSDMTISEKIDELSDAQVARVVQIVLPLLRQRYETQIPEETAKLIESQDTKRISDTVAADLSALGYSIKAEDILDNLKDDRARVAISRTMLKELSVLPEYSEEVDTAVESATGEMVIPAVAILAIGVAASLVILSTTVLVGIFRANKEDIPKIVEPTCDTLPKCVEAMSKVLAGSPTPLGDEPGKT
jgi:hypothetical protein